MRFNNPALVRVVGGLSGRMFKLLFATMNKTVNSPEHVKPYDADHEAVSQRYIYSVWHDLAILAAFGGRHTNTIALTSQHRDGSFVESTLRAVQVKTVRGSTGRGGGRAARRLLDIAKASDIIITPDGPRGPRRQLSRGIIYLASRSGRPIVPTAFGCSNAWEIQGSWTTQVIPKPFSRGIFAAGEPVEVPGDLGRDEIESYRMQVQQAMDSLQAEVDKAFNPANVVVQESGNPVLTRC